MNGMNSNGIASDVPGKGARAVEEPGSESKPNGDG